MVPMVPLICRNDLNSPQAVLDALRYFLTRMGDSILLKDENTSQDGIDVDIAHA